MTDQTNKKQWYVYIIECSDGAYYTGITTDLKRRFAEHAGNGKGAKFFYSRRPMRIVFKENTDDRSSASRREAQIKAMSRVQKEALIAAHHS